MNKTNLIEDLMEALWYWLPPDEPHDPHTKNKVAQFKNAKWAEACDLIAKTKVYLGK